MRIMIILLVCASTFMAEAFQSDYSFPLEGKIQGGKDVSITKMNFMAMLSHNGKFISHAFLISCKHALMAANHLVEFFTKWPLPAFHEYFLIVYGGIRPPPENAYEIEQVECHPEYRFSNPSVSYDIAVITLTEDVTPDIGTWIDIAENTKQNRNNYLVLEAVAWGLSFSPDGQANNAKLALKILPVINEEKMKCKLNYNQHIFCVTAEAKFDPWDIGTPLIYDRKAIGVFSTMYSKNENMSIYTDISVHYWKIDTMMKHKIKSTNTKTPRHYAKYNWKTHFG